MFRRLAIVMLVALFAMCNTTATNTTASSAIPPLRWQAYLYIALLVIFIVVLTTGLLKVLPAMSLMAFVLFITTLVSADDLFTGFSNNGNLSIALLFIVVHPISQLPLVTTLVEWLMRGCEDGQRWPLFKLCLISMLLSSFVENTPHVAIFTSMISRYCSRRGISPSPYLMPMSFAVILGNYAVFGSGSNLVISGLMEKNHIGSLPTFELAKAGLPALPVVLLYLVFLPKYLITQNSDAVSVRGGKRAYVVKCRVHESSRLIDRPFKEVGAAFPGGAESDVALRRVFRGGERLDPESDGVVQGGDVIVLVAPPASIVLSADLMGYDILSANDIEVHTAPHVAATQAEVELQASGSSNPQAFDALAVDAPAGGFYEIVLSASFTGQGCEVQSRIFQRAYRLSIASIRNGATGLDLGAQDMPHHILGPADTLLCYGPPDFAKLNAQRPDFLLINPLGATEESMHPLIYSFPRWVPWGTLVGVAEGKPRKALVMPPQFRYVTLLLFIGIVILSSLEVTRLSVLCFGVVVIYIVLGITNSREAVSTVHYEVYVVVAFSFPLGSALQRSGLGDTIGAAIAGAGIKGFALLLLLSVISLLLANVITNIASAQVILPIILSIYRGLPGEDPLAAIVTCAQVIVCAICTPYSIPPNMLILGPGGYTPRDYLKLGLPLSIIFTLIIPLFSALVYREFS